MRVPVIFVIYQNKSRANGGVESMTEIIEHLEQAAGLVVTQRESGFSQRWRQAGAQVLVWPIDYAAKGAPSGLRLPRRLLLVLSVLIWNWRMWRLVRSSRCRVVHCNDILSFWHAAFGARLAGARVVQSLRNSKLPGRDYPWHWKVAFALANRIIVLSDEMAARLDGLAARRRGEPAKITRIYSVVDSARLPLGDGAERRQLRGQLGIGADAYAVGYVAAFRPSKGQREFIEQCGPLLASQIPNGQVYFVGDFDPERDAYARACQAAAHQLGLTGRLHFAGYQEKIAEWYQAMDVIVVASQREGLARCMIEGLACGRPVVSFDVCSAHEILTGHQCGIVVPQGQYAPLVAALARLASEPAYRAELGRQGALAAERLFKPAAIGQAYETVYRELSEPARRS